ncbi:EF-hand domain-containing protein [Aurantiacibacter poecillastricola]|uniref:EF-hand domain-containing protein n=1 Tax=Aurantiacibacter poecillastricola TaxID=3064385 RepID=UPI00273D2BDD|nr:EF-hand domain-containing protein [Aurantiacibacter sp. 219JJ12-13]MDP5260767.1 EF-hand domain-containing protein [Aurantiacibacter sp. 219JJ12-13]
MNKTLILALAATGLALGSAATAQDRPERGADITRADAEARAATAFARMDANNDGVLDEADREARQRARFDRMDANGDGALTYEEMQAARETMQDTREDRRAERGERGRGQRMARRGAMRERLVQRADTDNDGAISEAEFTTAALARFERMDADNNGVVTAEERRDQRGERRRNRG